MFGNKFPCHSHATVFLAFLIFITIGCSGGGGVDPTVPIASNSDQLSESSLSTPPAIIEQTTSPMVFGIYEVEINPATLTGEIHSIRDSAALGDQLYVDITPFLMVNPCQDCIRIGSISLNEDNLVEVAFQVRHPFMPDTRYDLHVFDLRGIVVSGDHTRQFDRIRMDLDGNGSFETPCRGNVDMLANADGYTSFYDEVVENYVGRIFDSNICPYKIMWFNPATTSPDSNYNPSAQPENGFVDLQNPTGHNVFPMGGKLTDPLATTVFQFDFTETESTVFYFIVDASYAQTSIKNQRKSPRYFLPEFHRKEAWKVDAELTANELGALDTLSSATLRVSVMDWQAGIAPTGGWTYSTSNLTAIRYKSDVKQITVDIPGVLNSVINLGLTDLDSGNGSYVNPYVWDVDFTNQQGAGEGYYWGLVGVTDDLNGTLNTPLGISGSDMVPVRVNDMTTYQSFEVFVEMRNAPPVADITAVPNPVKACALVSFQPGPECFDDDGAITLYEYDFDYQGAVFNVNASNTDGSPVTFTYNETYLIAPYNGVVTAAIRVTDNILQTDIDTVSVNINPNQPPVAVIADNDSDNEVTPCDTVSFYPGAGTNDPDGSIELYEYDFDYDGSNFTVDASNTTGAAVQTSFVNTGTLDLTYDVALRVTDDGCPDMTGISVVTITVHSLSGQLLFENFESVTPGSVPSGWGVQGHTQGAYYLNTLNSGCNDPDWKWGVTQNAGLCEGGESRFLNESGHIQTMADPSECYQNRGNIVYTPEFTVPLNGATVTVRHNYNFTYAVPTGYQYVDGGRVILSVNNPDNVTWTDFCNYYHSPPYNNLPLRPLSIIGEPTLVNISYYTVATHPLYGMPAHGGSSAGWVTSTYSIPASYACQNVRLGFLFASDDLLLGYLSEYQIEQNWWLVNDCTQYLQTPYTNYVYPQWGWRINWMEITGN